MSSPRLARARLVTVLVAVTTAGIVVPGLAHGARSGPGGRPPSAALAAAEPTDTPTSAPTAAPSATPTSTPGETTSPVGEPTATPALVPPEPATVAVPVPPAATRPCRSGLVALTFDDGPAPGTTARLVALLTREHVPATFFMIGANVHEHPALARLVQREGFGVGNHTYRHPDLARMSARGVHAQLAATAVELRAAGVRPGPLMRPPYGATNRTVTSVARSMHLTPTLWSIDSLDWSRGTPAQIAHRVVTRLRPHQPNLVLQHDGVVRSPLSVAAVPAIVAGARHRGFCFAALDTRGRPTPPVPTATARTTDGGGAGGRPVDVRITLDRPTTRAVSLRVTTTGGTAVPGVGIASLDTVIALPAGATTASVRLPVTRGRTALATGGDGTVDVRVTPVSGVRVGSGQVTALVRRG